MRKKLLLGFLAGLFLIIMTGVAGATVMYSSLPDPYPHNLPSLGYQATSTQEFGDQIKFAAGTGRTLSTVTVALSDWATMSDWGNAFTDGYFEHDFKLNIYNIGDGTSPGALITSLTTVAQVPLKPNNWDMNGILFNIIFDGLGVTLPDEIIYGLAYNTQTHGYAPIGEEGPYNSLNFGLNSTNSVGINVDPDSVYWNTSYAGFYTDGGANGVNKFRVDTAWSGYVPAIEFTSVDPVPEPSTILLLGVGLVGLAGAARRKLKK